MCGVEAVVVAAGFVGDHDLRCWYVIVERGAGNLFGDVRCTVPCFGCGVIGHEDVDSRLIVGSEVEVW